MAGLSRRLFPLAAFLILLASCGEEVGQFDSAASIKPGASEVGPDSGSIFVSVTASGDWTMELEYPDASAADWATSDPASGTGSRADVRLRYDANSLAADRTVTLVLKPVRGLSARADVTQRGNAGSGPGGGDDPGGGSHGNVGISGKDVAAPDWLELPATKAGDGRTFYVHDMDGGEYIDARTSGVRNWSFYWDAEEHLSQWVAYPLNNALKGSGGRSNAWGLDPLLPADAQPNLMGGSYGGGWSRGHQLPSADRLTYRANVSTFYGTNMTPQEYNFNGEIWASLEGRVRNYAALSDTLYVVTGCLYEDSVLYSGKSSGFAVKVPTHYFKALLYRGVSTYATKGFMAAGFLLPHESSISSESELSYIMSIDELEAKTGIDFFPNLSALLDEKTAAAIEAQAPSNWWK